MALKLGIQALIYTYWQTLGEVLAIGSRAGLDLRAMLDVVADSPAALAALKSKIPAITGTDNEVAFALSAAAKDLGVIVKSGNSLGLHSEIVAKTLDCYTRAVAAGRGQHDIADIVPFTINARS
jgi:3-hydroxyisobutyrate dehydrogenase-like beta-hydroxyacid dehydrogenase